jgi:hypothetical protein
MAKMLVEGRLLGDIPPVFRNSPLGGGLPTPSLLLQERQLLATLSMHPEALLSQPPDTPSVRKILEKRVVKQAFYSPVGDYSTTTIPLLPEENIRVRRGNSWKPAKVVSHHSTPKSYLVRIEGCRIMHTKKQVLNQ